MELMACLKDLGERETPLNALLDGQKSREGGPPGDNAAVGKVLRWHHLLPTPGRHRRKHRLMVNLRVSPGGEVELGDDLSRLPEHEGSIPIEVGDQLHLQHASELGLREIRCTKPVRRGLKPC